MERSTNTGSPATEPTIFDLMAMARRIRLGSPSLKLTLMVLVEHMGQHDGVWSCWPSQGTLAYLTEQSDRNVRRHLKELEHVWGLVTTTTRAGDGQGRQSNVYMLDVDALTRGQPDRLSGGATGQSDQGQPANPGGGQPDIAVSGEVQRTTSEGSSGTTAFAVDRDTGFPTAESCRLQRAPYPTEFQEAWTIYPFKRGSKAGAYKAWLARCRDAKKMRVPIERRTQALYQAVVAYAEEVNEQGTEEPYVKHASTFFGAEDHWKGYARRKMDKAEAHG